MSTVWIILPAYNEAHGIAQVILSISEHLQAIPHHFVVVDDGSVDDTPNLVEKLPVPLTLLRHPKNQGLGKALQTALHHLIPLIDCKDRVFTAESDGTQSPSLFLKLLQAIQDGADIAVAAPQAYRGVPLYRRWCSRGANRLYRTLFPIPGLNAYTNLFRAYRASLLKEANPIPTRTGFEAVPEILLRLRPFSPKVAEIPVTIDFTQKGSPSSMNTFKNILSTLRLMILVYFGKKTVS